MEKKSRKRKAISLEIKIAILDRLAKGERSTDVAKHFGYGESTIRAIKKSEVLIRQSIISGTKLSSKLASYSRNVLVEKTEKALVIWIDDLTKKRIPLNGPIIKNKALHFYEQLKQLEPSTSSAHSNTSFSASKRWLTGFLKRNAFHNVKITGETASADEKAAKHYPEQLAKIIQEGGYCADQVFNADETGLFWKRMPTRTYIAKAEKKASGFKAAKDRVTFLLCSNASGDRMLKPLVINRSLRPRALKGKDLKKLPVHWMANKKAWVTSAVFTEWFHNCFIPEVEVYLKQKGLEFKVLLIVDNAPSHPNLDHSNVNLVFLPPNTTSIIQPLDPGIIATFKKYYVKRTFQFILSQFEIEPVTLTDVWKKFSILDCINHATSAIGEIRPHTLNAGWKTLWPQCIINRNAINQEPIVSAEIISLAHEIGGEGFDFNDNDVDELLLDQALTDDDVIELFLDYESDCDEEDCQPALLTAKTI